MALLKEYKQKAVSARRAYFADRTNQVNYYAMEYAEQNYQNVKGYLKRKGVI